MKQKQKAHIELNLSTVDVAARRHPAESYDDYRQRQQQVKRALRLFRTVRPKERLPQERYSPPQRKHRDNDMGAQPQIIPLPAITVPSQRLTMKRFGEKIWVPDVIRVPRHKIIWHQKTGSY